MKWFNGRELVPAVLAVVAFVIAAVTTPYFLDWRYLIAHTSLFIEAGFMALGMTLVIICGEIDLSVASTLSLVACASAMMMRSGISPVIAMGAGVMLGAGLGCVNGLLISKLKLPSFVVTLATMAAYRGISQILLKADSVPVPNAGVGQNFLWEFGLATVCVGLLLHRTVLGRWIYARGANERAAFFSGIPTAKVLIIVFTLNGVLAGIAGLVMNLRLGVARFDDGLGLELDAITAVVLGGASIYGGVGTIAGTVLALLLLGIVRTQMGISNVTAEYQLAVIGSLLVVSILLGNLVERFFRLPRTAKRVSS